MIKSIILAVSLLLFTGCLREKEYIDVPIILTIDKPVRIPDTFLELEELPDELELSATDDREDIIATLAVTISDLYTVIGNYERRLNTIKEWEELQIDLYEKNISR